MKDHPTYEDLESMLNDNFTDTSPADEFIELCCELETLIAEKKEAMQDLINTEVEYLIDSFGGKDCTMRDLKGE